MDHRGPFYDGHAMHYHGGNGYFTEQLMRPIYQAAVMQPQQPHWGPREPYPQDNRPWLLFDLNGVLVEESKYDQLMAQRQQHEHDPNAPSENFQPAPSGRFPKRRHFRTRPGIIALLHLRPRYRLGIYTSATHHTVRKAMESISGRLAYELRGYPDWLEGLAQESRVHGGGGSGGGQQLDARVLFNRVLHREHCAPDPTRHSRPDGRDWDTIKPLAAHGLPLMRCLLVDNETRKSAPGEEANMLLLPTWEVAADEGSAVWSALVAELLALPQGPELDVRHYSAAIASRLVGLHVPLAPPPEPAPPFDPLEDPLGELPAAQLPPPQQEQEHQQEDAEAAAAEPIQLEQPPPLEQHQQEHQQPEAQQLEAQQHAEPQAEAIPAPSRAALLDSTMEPPQQQQQEYPPPPPELEQPIPATSKKQRRAAAIAAASAAAASSTADTGLGADRRPLWASIKTAAAEEDPGRSAPAEGGGGSDGTGNLEQEEHDANEDGDGAPAAKRRWSSSMGSDAVPTPGRGRGLPHAVESGGAAGGGPLPCGGEQGPPGGGPQGVREREAEAVRVCAQYLECASGQGTKADLRWTKRAMKDKWRRKRDDPRVGMMVACCVAAAQAATRGSAGHNALLQVVTGRWARHGGAKLMPPTRDFASRAVEAALQAGLIRTVPRPGRGFLPRYVPDPVSLWGPRDPADTFPGGVEMALLARADKRQPPPQQEEEEDLGGLRAGGDAMTPVGSSADVDFPAAGAPLPGMLLHLVQQAVADISAADAVFPEEVAALIRDLTAPLSAILNTWPLPDMCTALEKWGVLGMRRLPQMGRGYYVRKVPPPQLAAEAFRSVLAGEPYDEGRMGPGGVVWCGKERAEAGSGRREGGEDDGDDEGGSAEGGRGGGRGGAGCEGGGGAAGSRQAGRGGREQQPHPEPRQQQRTPSDSRQQRQQQRGYDNNDHGSDNDGMDSDDMHDVHYHTTTTTHAAHAAGHKRQRPLDAPNTAATTREGCLPGAVPLYGRPWICPVPPAMAAAAAAAGEAPGGSSSTPSLSRPSSSTPAAAPRSQGPPTPHPHPHHRHHVVGRRPLSALHGEVAAFAAASAPSESELGAISRGLVAVQRVATSLWGPSARVVLFGSQAAGLALLGSDLDLVVLGVMPALATPAQGFGKAGRNQAARLLDQFARRLHAEQLIGKHNTIRNAKVPIVKTTLLPPDQAGRLLRHPAGGPRMAADISIGVANGATAVALVQRAVAWLPPLRPLCLVVKALLKQSGLNEVFSGGLSSYSLINMVIAHLLCEGFTMRPTALPPLGQGAVAAGGAAVAAVTPGGGIRGGERDQPPAKRRRGDSGSAVAVVMEEEGQEDDEEGEGWQGGEDSEEGGEGEEEEGEEEEEEWVASDGGSSEDDGGDDDLDPDLDVHFEMGYDAEPSAGMQLAAAAQGGGRGRSSTPHTTQRRGEATPSALRAGGSPMTWLRTPGGDGESTAEGLYDEYGSELAAITKAAAAASEAAALINVSGDGAGAGGGRGRQRRGRGRSSAAAEAYEADGSTAPVAAVMAAEGLPAAQLSYLRALSRQDVSGSDLGELLVGFFVRYGQLLNPDIEAVSILRGGIFTKPHAWVKGVPKHPTPAWATACDSDDDDDDDEGRGGRRVGVRLSVEDPQQPGRDIAGGSRKVAAVLAAFDQAGRALAGASASQRPTPSSHARGSQGTRSETERERALWVAVQADGSHTPLGQGAADASATSGSGRGDGARPSYDLLRRVLDLDLALSRSEEAARRRAKLSGRGGPRLRSGPQTDTNTHPRFGGAGPSGGDGAGGSGGGEAGDFGAKTPQLKQKMPIHKQRIAMAVARRKAAAATGGPNNKAAAHEAGVSSSAGQGEAAGGPGMSKKERRRANIKERAAVNKMRKQAATARKKKKKKAGQGAGAEGAGAGGGDGDGRGAEGGGKKGAKALRFKVKGQKPGCVQMKRAKAGKQQGKQVGRGRGKAGGREGGGGGRGGWVMV